MNGKEDLVNSYILHAMAHDGSMPLIATPTGIRVVCWNTLNTGYLVETFLA